MEKTQEVSLKDVLLKIYEGGKFILRKWYFLLLFMFIGGVCAYLYESQKIVMYQAKTTFILEEGAGGASSVNLGGLSNLLGGSSAGSAGLFKGESLFELYKSRSILDEVLLSPISTDNSKLLIQELFDINPDLQENLSESNRKFLEDRNFLINPTKDQLRRRDSILNGAVNTVTGKYFTVGFVNVKASIIQVLTTAESEIFAKTFNDQLVEKVNSFYLEIKGGNSYKDVRILQSKVDSLKAVMASSIATSAVSTDQIPNLNPTRQSLKEVPIKAAAINLETSKSLYAELNKNLEMAKLSLGKEIPLIKIIDDARFPLNKITPQIKKMTIIGVVLGLFLICGILSFTYIIKSILQD